MDEKISFIVFVTWLQKISFQELVRQLDLFFVLFVLNEIQ